MMILTWQVFQHRRYRRRSSLCCLKYSHCESSTRGPSTRIDKIFKYKREIYLGVIRRRRCCTLSSAAVSLLLDGMA